MTKTQKTRLFDVLIIGSTILVVHFIVTAVNAHSNVHNVPYEGLHQQPVPQHQLDTISVYQHCSDLYEQPEEWYTCIVKAAENAGMIATTTESDDHDEEVIESLLEQQYDQ